MINLAVSSHMSLTYCFVAGLQNVLGRAICQSLVALLVCSLCTGPFSTYDTVQNCKLVGASNLIKISGITSADTSSTSAGN